MKYPVLKQNIVAPPRIDDSEAIPRKKRFIDRDDEETDALVAEEMGTGENKPVIID